jgi:chemotaxis signal transduction protein
MYVFLRLGGERYALPARQVREALPFREPRGVPSTLPGLLGMLTVRDGLLSVFDLATILGVPSSAPGSVVIAVDRWGRTVGLAVEAVESIDEVVARDLRPPQSDAPGVAALAFTPTGLALLLDADALVAVLHR